jgi:hypothetical protein
MPAGYSGKPLADKLGIQAGTAVHAVGAPPDYAELLGPVPADVEVQTHRSLAALRLALRPSGGQARFLHCFAATRPALARSAPALALALAPGGVLWVSWPKLAAARSLGLPGDISEDTLRELLLPTGLVDVKVCAVSDVWSGLKFVWRRPLG